MGLLPVSAVDIVSEQSYGAGTGYTGTGYLDSGLQFWEEMAVNQFFPRTGKILVGSAGGGRELIALARAGYWADGFECSSAMVAAGRKALAERQIEGALQWAPPSSVPRMPTLYDAGIVGWNGYTYISPKNRRIEFLQSMAEHIRAGAPILVSCAIRVGRGRAAVWTPRVANAVRALTFRPRVFTAGDAFPGRPRHEFTRQQLNAELQEAGLEPVAFWRWGGFGAAIAFKATREEQSCSQRAPGDF